MSGPFKPVEGMSSTMEVIEYAAEYLTPGVAIEELTIMVEGFERSEMGREVLAEVLAAVDPSLRFEPTRGRVSRETVVRLQQAINRGVLPVRITELAIHESLVVRGWDPATKESFRTMV